MAATPVEFWFDPESPYYRDGLDFDGRYASEVLSVLPVELPEEERRVRMGDRAVRDADDAHALRHAIR